MRRRLIVVMALMLLFTGACLSAHAEDENTSDDMVTGAEDNESVGSTDDRGFLGGLRDAGDMSEENDTALKAAAPLRKGVEVIIQVISYVVVVGLSLRVALDLTYIALPFSRTLLGGTVEENRRGAAGASYGGNGLGSGIYGGGPGLYGGNGMYGGGPGASVSGPGGKMQFVSGAAIQAVSRAATPGSDGKSPGAIRLYVKDMAVMLVGVPILLVLLLTGALTDIGFTVGELVGGVIEQILGGTL